MDVSREIRIWIGRLSKEDPPSPVWAGVIQITESPSGRKGEAEKGYICSLCLSWDIHLPSQTGVLSSWAFGLRLNNTTSFPGTPAYRPLIMWLLSLHMYALAHMIHNSITSTSLRNPDEYPHVLIQQLTQASIPSFHLYPLSLVHPRIILKQI